MVGRRVDYRSTRTLGGQWIYIHRTLLVSVVSREFMYVTHEIVHFTYGPFVVHLLCFNKIKFKIHWAGHLNLMSTSIKKQIKILNAYVTMESPSPWALSAVPPRSSSSDSYCIWDDVHTSPFSLRGFHFLKTLCPFPTPGPSHLNTWDPSVLVC